MGIHQYYPADHAAFLKQCHDEGQTRPPPLPADMHRVERLLARATHLCFYVLLFAMPLSGWLLSSAKNYSVSWFGAFTWPNLSKPSYAAFGFFKSRSTARISISR